METSWLMADASALPEVLGSCGTDLDPISDLISDIGSTSFIICVDRQDSVRKD